MLFLVSKERGRKYVYPGRKKRTESKTKETKEWFGFLRESISLWKGENEKNLGEKTEDIDMGLTVCHWF